MCPFCYIGKRRFEEALQQFENKDQIELQWKSFQLNPALKTVPGQHINEYLAASKGWTPEYAREMNDYVTGMAAQAGLTFDFDKAVVANSFNAHRLSHLAAKHGLGDAAEEILFKAYFTEGRNTDDLDTLIELGASIGLNPIEVRQTLESDAYADAVKQDIEKARKLGIQGVPFFVMNNKYGVSGAQAATVFAATLEKSFTEWQQENPAPGLTVIEGESCRTDGSGDCG